VYKGLSQGVGRDSAESGVYSTTVLCRRCTRSWARVWGGTVLSQESILPVYCAGGVQGAEPGCGAGQRWVRSLFYHCTVQEVYKELRQGVGRDSAESGVYSTSVLCRRSTRSWARVWGGTALSQEYILPVYCAGGVQGAEPGCGAGQPWVREPVQRLRERPPVWAGLRTCGNLRSTCSAPQFLFEGASYGVFWPFLLSMVKNRDFTIFLSHKLDWKGWDSIDWRTLRVRIISFYLRNFCCL
jgi:hypothetical protein